MKCVKCGKKIPKGEIKICKDCQNKLLEEIKNEEDIIKVKKKKEFTNKLEIWEKIFILICIIIIITSILVSTIILVKRKIAIDKANISTTDSMIGNTVGNTIANIRYYGFCAMQDNWIYYYTSNEDFSVGRICKIKEDGSNKSVIFEYSNMQIYSINALNGYIYFTGIIAGIYSDTDEIDNKIYRMKNDGSELEVINDNNFNNESYSIYAIKDKIYFVGTDFNIYRMNLDGSSIEKISDYQTGFLGVTEKYIIFDKWDSIEDEQIQVTYIMDLDGNNPRPVIEGENLRNVNIENDYVYYLDVNQYIYRTKIDSNTVEPIHLQKTYLLNIYNNYAYYFDYYDEENMTVGIYRIDLLDSLYTPELIKTLSKMSYYLDIVGDYANYIDSNNSSVIIHLLKTDGSLTNYNLFIYNVEDVKKYYNSIDETESILQENG